MESKPFYLKASISPSKLCITPTSYQQKKRKESITSLLNLSANVNYGAISTATSSKIKQAITLICNTAEVKYYQLDDYARPTPFKVNFITLTLPSLQCHSDVQIKNECLNQLLTEWRKEYPSLKYCWRAEKQRNNNIHFHIITNVFIHYKNIRDDWNRVLNKLGYIDKYANHFQGLSFESYKSKCSGSKVSDDVLRRRFEGGNKAGWKKPNTTDVHSVKGINDIAAYISKYCSKSSPAALIPNPKFKLSNVVRRRKLHIDIKDIVQVRMNSNIIQGKVWGCDSATSKFKNVTITEHDSDWNETISAITPYANFVAVKEYITVYYGNFHKLLMSLPIDSCSLYQLNISSYINSP